MRTEFLRTIVLATAAVAAIGSSMTAGPQNAPALNQGAPALAADWPLLAPLALAHAGEGD